MLGASNMVNKDQIHDCLDRNWIVVAPNHRLCPQVDLHTGPMKDVRDCLSWVYEGGLDAALQKAGIKDVKVDTSKVLGFGTSSGGHLAKSLCWGVKRTPAAVLDMYGPCNFENHFWNEPLPHIGAKLPPGLTSNSEFLNKIYDQKPCPISAGVSLEGQALPPDFSDPRQAFAMSAIAEGRVIKSIYPKGKDIGYQDIDPLLNVSSDWPPVAIVHGTADTSVPFRLNEALFQRLQDAGVRSELIRVEGEEHTFAGKMVKGDATWGRQRLGFDFLEKVIT